VASKGDMMNEFHINVTGMHCPSCEMLVAEELGDISGVTAVQADHKRHTVSIKYDGTLDVVKVKAAISALGYKVNE
jgi:copper chaperone